MSEKLKKPLFNSLLDLVIIIIIVYAIVTMYEVIQEIRTEGAECVSNPMVYTAQHLTDLNSPYSVQCSCEVFKPNNPPKLYFDNESVWKQKITTIPAQRYPNITWSVIE